MDSLGAVYSRVSSHIFGDWNACGKVMGLAPWQGHVWDTDGSKKLTSKMPKEPILQGTVYNEVEIDKSSMMGLPFISRSDPDMFNDEGEMIRSKRYDFDDNDFEEIILTDDEGNEIEDEQKHTKQLPLKVALDAIGLASRVQTDLESVGMDFVKHFKEETGQTNLCLAGGVALNSVLNGRLSRELGFENTFIPAYPGDDGIAVGCCAFGLYGNHGRSKDKASPPLWKETLSPYLGPLYTDADIKDAIAAANPWLDVTTVRNEDERINVIVKEIASSGVVALFTGRSELGPRALGHRSILADPRKKGLVRFINEFVKKRESFRPFAPSALAEEASAWFDLGEYAAKNNNNVSPYMSITAQVKKSKQKLIPAVTHVDGSSRLQTVTAEAEPFYHRLISAFYKETGVPMVLNTSFNTLKSEPIVETPKNAIRSFLSSMGSIQLLVIGDYVIRRKQADVRKLLGEKGMSGMLSTPTFPIRAGAAYFKSTFSASEHPNDDGDSMSDPKTLVQIPKRPMHNELDGGWFELVDDLEGQLLGMCDGTSGVNDMISYYSALAEEEEQDDNEKKLKSSQFTEDDQLLVENVLRRLIRLYDSTMISW
jgi:carbamoyltransferase